MKYEVKIQKRMERRLEKLPTHVQKKLLRLVMDLRDKGPAQPDWPNYRRLNNDEYHCHLSYSWVACWRNEKNTIIIEVYYVGSREKAPY
jgi:mRNA-degrading endonuclease RelE of RelBE toxin-antitoxin system